MSNWERIDYNPHNGLSKYIGDHPDDPDGVTVRYSQDAAAIQAILDRNKSSQADPFDRKADMWHAAHVPVGVMYEWKVKHGVDAWKYSSCEESRKRVNALLNSSEYRYLRVKNFVI